MKLNIIIDEKTIPIALTDEILTGAEELFNKMDADMSKGWQMSRTWVEAPSPVQRCQIVADKLLTAIENNNQASIGILSAYIVRRLQGVTGVQIDTSGDMTETLFTR